MILQDDKIDNGMNDGKMKTFLFLSSQFSSNTSKSLKDLFFLVY